jgi:hypothetical protein
VNRQRRNIFALGLILPAALLLTACLHGAPKSSHKEEIGREMRVEGELVRGQFGCLSVLTAEGRRYSLARDLDGSKPGQRVWVEGYVVKTKGCMPGTTLMPRQAGLLDGIAVTETARR